MVDALYKVLLIETQQLFAELREKSQNSELDKYHVKAVAELFNLLSAKSLLAPLRWNSSTEDDVRITSTRTVDAVLLELSNLDLIDTSKTSWEQIIAFRADKQSARSLRRLVHFYRDSYEQKDASHIKDDIEIRIEDYQKAVESWGFETVTGSTSLVLDSKSIIATGGMAFTAAIFGAPSLSIASMGAGAAIEIGKLAIHIAQRKHGLRQLLADNPIGFIIDAKKQLE